MPVPLLGFILSSASQGELYLLNGQCILETGHLGRQILDLGLSPCLPTEQFLLHPLGILKLPTQVLHFGLRRIQAATVSGTPRLRSIGQAQEP